MLTLERKKVVVEFKLIMILSYMQKISAPFTLNLKNSTVALILKNLAMNLDWKQMIYEDEHDY